jgi:hypothetical protein
MRRWAVVLLIGLGGVLEAHAQDHRLLPTTDRAYEYLARLQRRGHLLDLHPTALPYRHAEVVAALSRLDRGGLDRTEARWVHLLEQMLVPPRDSSRAQVGASLAAGLAASSNRRLDPLRFLETGAWVYPNAALHLFLAHRRTVAETGLRFDTWYDRDPDGLDAVKRIMTRSDHSYLGFAGGSTTVYLGRFSNHWGLHGAAAPVVSHNPRSYDQVHLRFGGERLALRSLLGELDSITGDGRFTGEAGDDSVRSGSERRYVAAHRFDWRPSRHLGLTLLEATLFSGPNSGPSLRYLNPLHPVVIELDNRPKNDENNGLVAAMLWAQTGRITLYGQLMVDDFDFLNGSEPASFAFSGSLHRAGRRADLGLTAEAVAVRTYNALQTEGQYHYLLRGLGTQFSDYVALGVQADLYPLSGLILTPRLDVLLQGAGHWAQPFPGSDVGAILTGTVARTLRASVQGLYQPDPRWWLRFDVGPSLLRNAGHVAGHNQTRWIGQLEVGARLSLNRAYRLEGRP